MEEDDYYEWVEDKRWLEACAVHHELWECFYECDESEDQNETCQRLLWAIKEGWTNFYVADLDEGQWYADLEDGIANHQMNERLMGRSPWSEKGMCDMIPTLEEINDRSQEM